MKRRDFLHLLTVAGMAGPLRGTRLSGVFAGSLNLTEIRRNLAEKRLFIVPFSHVDWAWTNTRDWMIRRHAEVLDEVLDILKETPEFRFFIENWNEQTDAFLQQRPERIAELREAIEEGKVAVCGGVANQHPGWFESESYVRNLVMGRRLFRELAPRANLDVMSHIDVTPGCSQMPQILTKAGYSSYRLNRPDEALNASGIPMNFVWRGLDGSKILSSRGFACGFMSERSVSPEFGQDWEGAVTDFFVNEIEQRLVEPYGGNLVWLPFGCDDSLPLKVWHPVKTDEGWTEVRVPAPEFIAAWNRAEAAPLAFANPIEYFRELANEREDLPEVEGVIDPTMWTYWYGLNGNRSLRIWRTRTDMALVAAEHWSAVARTLGEEYPQERFEQLWRDLLGTFSHAQNWLLEEDYSERLGQVKRAFLNAGELLDDVTQKIAGRVEVQDNRSAVLVFNDLPWERTDVVEVRPQFQQPDMTNFVVHDGNGNRLPHQILDLNWWRLGDPPAIFRDARVLVEATVPPLGYTTLYFDPAPGQAVVPQPDLSTRVIETSTARIQCSERGVEWILDEVSGLRYEGAGNVVYNQIEETGPYHYGPVVRTLKLKKGKLTRLVQGSLRSEFSIEGNLGPHRLSLTGLYYPKSRRLAFRTRIESEGGSGHFMTSVGLPGEGRLFANVQFGVEPRDVAKIQYVGQERRRKNVFWGEHWVTYSAPDSGVTLVGTTGERGYQYFPGEHVLGHFLLMTNPPAPADSWERFVTEAREGKGPHSFDYQLLFHSGDWKDSNAVGRAMEARYPLRAVFNHDLQLPGDRSLPVRKGFLSISPPAVQLSAFYREGNRFLLRIYECLGSSARVSVGLPFSPGSAHEVDFNGESRGKQIRVTGSSLEFDMAPWEIVTLALE